MKRFKSILNSIISASWSNVYISKLSDLHFSRWPWDLQIGLLFTLLAVLVRFVWLHSRNKRSQLQACLDPKRYKDFRLLKRTQLTHNTTKFTFALSKPNSILGLPVGQHVRCRGKDSQAKEVTRPYTPVTLDSDHGYFELVVKLYPKGRMSNHFGQMREGDYLAVTGPLGRFKYKPGQARAFGMIAGGTGITPMFQITRAILENPKDNTKIHLLYANTTVQDILLKEEIDGFATKHPEQFHVYYIVSQPPETWDGGVGRINKNLIQKHYPAPAFHIKILKCGPPSMNMAMSAYLQELGYTREMQFEF